MRSRTLDDRGRAIGDSSADSGVQADPRAPAALPPLRILAHSLSLTPIGGVEICTLQDSLALAERGHRVDIMYGADGSLRSTYEAAGVGLRGPYSFGFAPRRSLPDLARFVAPARWARTRSADVLWLNRFEHIVWGQTVARWADCPLVCHLHGSPMFRRIRELSHGVAHFIAVSQYVREAYIASGLNPDRVSLVYNAIPKQQYPFGGALEQLKARESLGLPLSVPIVLCYGQMTPEKGVPTLLEAWRKLGERSPGAILLLVDSMSNDAKATLPAALERELLLLDPHSYRRFPITADVLRFLHACDIVVFPSLLQEAFGRVVIEGMATGRPVVASRVGAVPEILSGPMTRFLVEPSSPGQLADRLASLLDWREREPRLGQECAEWVERRFPFSRHVDELESILQRHRRRPTTGPSSRRPGQ
jgi:glycosyltransferase involved in cell wall biosynthesis